MYVVEEIEVTGGSIVCLRTPKEERAYWVQRLAAKSLGKPDTESHKAEECTRTLVAGVETQIAEIVSFIGMNFSSEKNSHYLTSRIDRIKIGIRGMRSEIIRLGNALDEEIANTGMITLEPTDLEKNFAEFGESLIQQVRVENKSI